MRWRPRLLGAISESGPLLAPVGNASRIRGAGEGGPNEPTSLSAGGRFVALLSEYDQEIGYGRKWLSKIPQIYKEKRTIATARAKGYLFQARDVVRTASGQQIRLRFGCDLRVCGFMEARWERCHVIPPGAVLVGRSARNHGIRHLRVTIGLVHPVEPHLIAEFACVSPCDSSGRPVAFRSVSHSRTKSQANIWELTVALCNGRAELSAGTVTFALSSMVSTRSIRCFARSSKTASRVGIKPYTS